MRFPLQCKSSVVALLLSAVPGLAATADAPGGGRYLAAARDFADTLLRVGLDRHGPRPTAMWCAVIDAETLLVPRDAAAVPTLPGIRDHDRAVGGSNFYHDLATLKLFEALSASTGDPRYRAAARAYGADFLRLCQSPDTGLLAWGEHLYYDVFRDRVAVERVHHEFLEATPPWHFLAGIDSEAVTRAIAGLRYHFRSASPSTYLFNRHTTWLTPTFQEAGQPWIKHSGLQAYSFAYVLAQTGDRQWQSWLQGTSELYWSRRNPKTDLTLGCIDDPRPEARDSTLGGTSRLAYALLRAWQLLPAETGLRDRAVALFLAAEKYSRAENGYWLRTDLDGNPTAPLMSSWSVRYGEPAVVPVGRLAAGFASILGDPLFVEIAARIHAQAFTSLPPPDSPIENVGIAVHLALDLHSLKRNPDNLADACRLADFGLARYLRNGLFVRRPGDRFYEAKLGPGIFASSLLRLSLHLEKPPSSPPNYAPEFAP